MKRFLNFPDGVGAEGGFAVNSYKNFKVNIDSISGSAYTTAGATMVFLPSKVGINMVVSLQFDGLSSDDDIDIFGIQDAQPMFDDYDLQL